MNKLEIEFHKQLLKQQDPLTELMKSKAMRKSNHGRTVTRGNAYAANTDHEDIGISLFIKFCIVVIVGVLSWMILIWLGVM